MKLDPRIKDGKKPLDCFDTETANDYVGKECYFSNDIYPFANITDKDNRYQIYKGTLLKVWPDGSDSYETDLQRFYTYCLPFDWVTETKEKKYIPFRYMNELQECGIKVGKILAVRNNNYPEVTSSVIVSEVNYNPETLEVINITLGATGFEFGTLFESYSFYDGKEWKPLGVENDLKRIHTRFQ